MTFQVKDKAKNVPMLKKKIALMYKQGNAKLTNTATQTAIEDTSYRITKQGNAKLTNTATQTAIEDTSYRITTRRWDPSINYAITILKFISVLQLSRVSIPGNGHCQPYSIYCAANCVMTFQVKGKAKDVFKLKKKIALMYKEGNVKLINTATQTTKTSYDKYFEIWDTVETTTAIGEEFWGNEDTLYLASIAFQRPIVDIICSVHGYLNVGVVFPTSHINRHDVTSILHTYQFPRNAVYIYFENGHYDALIPKRDNPRKDRS